MFNTIYQELVFLKKEYHYVYAILPTADRTAFLAALSMIGCLFLPWFSYNHRFSLPGIMSGGVCHFVLAIMTIKRVKKAFKHHLKCPAKFKDRDLIILKLKRISLSYISIGLTAVVIIFFQIFYFLWQPFFAAGIVDIRFGLYFTGFFGFIIFLCGLERFL